VATPLSTRVGWAIRLQGRDSPYLAGSGPVSAGYLSSKVKSVGALAPGHIFAFPSYEPAITMVRGARHPGVQNGT
jgi:hypothetical protein